MGMSPMGLSLLFFGVPCLLEALAEAGMEEAGGWPQGTGREAGGASARRKPGSSPSWKAPLVLWLFGFG